VTDLMFEDQLAQIPTGPPRPLQLLPGLRFASAVSRSTLVLVLLLVSLFIFVPLSIERSDPAARLAWGPTRTTQGRVLSATSVSACRGSSAHRVHYAFSPEPGRELHGATTVCEASPYYSVAEGDPVEVKFASGDPSINALAAQGSTNNDAPPLFIFLFFPLFFLAFLAPMFVPQLRELLRVRRAFRNGQLATATVIFVKKRMTSTWPGWPGSSASDVYVAFQTPAGERREAVAWCPNDWLIYNLAPGAKVHIAYNDNKRARVALLEAFLR
jgi:hypothetical protein